MTVTREHAQMLTALAIACRPHRAPTWDEPGVMAAIAKVKDRDLPMVALAVIRAAADREAATPGVIPSAGSHWQEQLKPPKWEPERLPRQERCSVCAHPRHDGKCPRCAVIDDHVFEPDVRRDAEVDVGRTVGALRELVVDAKATPETTTPAEAAMAAPATTEAASVAGANEESADVHV